MASREREIASREAEIAAEEAAAAKAQAARAAQAHAVAADEMAARYRQQLATQRQAEGDVSLLQQVASKEAAEAAEEAATLKELRKAQMDRPPPVAMKKNAETGEMEKFESPALKDDLPQEVRATL